MSAVDDQKLPFSKSREFQLIRDSKIDLKSTNDIEQGF